MSNREASWVWLVAVCVVASTACSAASSTDAFPSGELGSTAGSKGDPPDNPPGNDAAVVDAQEPQTSPETCGNGLDDDGNGFVDEECGCPVGSTQPCFAGNPEYAGKGACTSGVQTCENQGSSGEFQSGAWGECVGAVAPSEEACDGLDNNCDGTVDDGCACGEGETTDCSTKCGAGKQTCANGNWGACNAPQPAPEKCDGKDNDCDGEVDEGLTKNCFNECGWGTSTCSAGKWGACDAYCEPCTTFECNGQCCGAGAGCCPDGKCPDSQGNCPCPTVECKGECCAKGTACCGDGSCPDAQGNCGTPCPTVVCDGACCPKGTQCCGNGACPDPSTGQCSSELDQCAGKPEVEVYAHSGMTLYRVEPTSMAMTSVGLFSGCGGQVIDIALDKGGQMYGTVSSAVLKINKSTALCTPLASGSTYPNSLSFVPEGTVYPDKEALVGYDGGTYVVIDTTTGAKTAKSSLPSGYYSSGDVVSVAGVGTFVSVNGNGCSDCLLKVDPKTGTMISKVGSLGYASVWGLAYWKGKLYGFTNPGTFFTFDLTSKASAPVNSSTGYHFNGAGSTTCAPQ